MVQLLPSTQINLSNNSFMNYALIDNLISGDRHLEKIRQHFEASEEVLIASPFLMNDFSTFFTNLNTPALKRFDLVTTLPLQAFEQQPKISSLLSLLSVPIFTDGNIKCSVSLNNSLHGKIYIFKKAGGAQVAIISSANFTNNGLAKWHEWGVEVYDSVTIDGLERSLRNSIHFADISKEQLQIWQERVNIHLADSPAPSMKNQMLDLLSDLKGKNLTDLLSSNPTIWLKPIGATGYPVTSDRLFDDAVYPLHFAKEPKSVKIGDIVICYGVGAGKLLSVYRVFSPVRRATPDQVESEEWMKRWSWIKDGQNLTPNYGRNWYSNDLLLKELRVDFLNSFPVKNITLTSQSLGALHHGSDKFRLSREFGEYLLNAIWALE